MFIRLILVEKSILDITMQLVSVFIIYRLKAFSLRLLQLKILFIIIYNDSNI